jgi:hypothetical protein
VTSAEVALASIARIFSADLSLPPIVAEIALLPSRAAFEHELLAAGYDAAFARDAAARMRAVALHRRVLVNEAAFRQSSWPGRLGTLAHELVHILQYDLAGGKRGTSEQWLREGLAEWIALDVLARLDAFPRAAARRYLEDELAASRRERAPRLDDMMTFRQWVALAGRTDVVPHIQAVLMVDLLVARHGLPAILDYFRRFATREDPPGNFLLSFRQTRDSFEHEVANRLSLWR